MFSFLGSYYGIDWLAMALTFVGIYQLSNKKRSGFLVHFLGNVLWLVLGILTQSAALLLANLLYGLMNVHAYYKWRSGQQ